MKSRLVRDMTCVLVALAACKYSGPCELVPAPTRDPTKINSADWIIARTKRPAADPNSTWRPHQYAPFVMTDREAEIETWFDSSRCAPDDPRLTHAKVEITTPSGGTGSARIKVGPEWYEAKVPEFSNVRPDPARVMFRTRIIFTPSETGMHTLRADFNGEGILDRHVFVSQSHTFDEVLITLPWACYNVERTALGTWVCDSHATTLGGLTHEFPAGALVSVAGDLVFVWSDSGFEVLQETAPMDFLSVATIGGTSTWAERHQLLLDQDRALLVSSRELRLLRLEDGGLFEESKGATPIAPREEDAGAGEQPGYWDWGISYSNGNVLLFETFRAATGFLVARRLCVLETASFAPSNCVPVEGNASAVNSRGAWVSRLIPNDGVVTYGVSDGGIVLTNSYLGVGGEPGALYGRRLSAQRRDGGYPGKPGARRVPRGELGAWTTACGLPKTELDGGMTYHVYPEEELETYSHFQYCDASSDHVWVWSPDPSRELTHVYPR